MRPGLFSSHRSLSGSSFQPLPLSLPCRWPIAVQLAISESLVWSVNDLYQRLQVKRSVLSHALIVHMSHLCRCETCARCRRRHS